MREKTICFTGHRDISDKQSVSDKLDAILDEYIKKGYRFFGAGGALGFDTLAALAVLKQKAINPEVKLILVLPCKNQTRGWKKSDIEIYESIKRQSDKVVYVSETYYDGCMQKRNRHLVDNSSICVCYLTKNNGGTAYTVEYAKKHGLMVINIGRVNLMSY